MQHDGVHSVQCSEPVDIADQDAPACQSRAENGVEHGVRVAGRLRRRGDDRLRCLVQIATEEQRGQRSEQATVHGAARVVLDRGSLPPDVRHHTDTRPVRGAERVVGRVEGGCPCDGLGQLTGVHQQVERQLRRGLAEAASSRGRRCPDQFRLLPADVLVEHGPDHGMLTQCGDGGLEPAVRAGRVNHAATDRDGKSGGVQSERGRRGPHRGGVAGMGQDRVVGIGCAVRLGKSVMLDPLADPVEGGVRGGLLGQPDHETAQSTVPVRFDHVRMFSDELGQLPDPGCLVRVGGPQRHVHAATGPPWRRPWPDRVADDPARQRRGRDGGRRSLLRRLPGATCQFTDRVDDRLNFVGDEHRRGECDGQTESRKCTQAIEHAGSSPHSRHQDDMPG